MKIVINNCFGGFSLSHAAVMLYAKKKGIELFAYVNVRTSDDKKTDFNKFEEYKGAKSYFRIHYSTSKLSPDGRLSDKGYFSTYNFERNDPILVEVVEELGEAANGDCAKLSVVEIPDGVTWEIDEYDGQESIHETHRSWN